MSIFEKASRIGVRFESSKGLLSVEDLWVLPLTSTKGQANLDDIAVDLNHLLQDAQTESFVKKAVKTNEELQLKFDIVKHIIDTRLAEDEAAKTKALAAAKKAKVLEFIARKQDEVLEKASIEELQAMLE